MSIGIVIIIVAVLLFLRERFDINLNPLTLINQGQKVSEAVSTITVDRMSGYRKIPQTYINGETIDVIANFKNTGNAVATDSFTFKAYKVEGIWDTLKKEISYKDRKAGATIVEGKELFLETNLLQMIKEESCVAIKGNCYDNININDQNNKFGGVEVKFEEPKYEIKFDSTVAKGEGFSQKISFLPEDCGYYMLVIGNKKYWSSATSGVSKVSFIAVDKCVKGEIASGISDTRKDTTVKPSVKDTAQDIVEELPQAGAESTLFAGMLLFFAAMVKARLDKAK